MATQKDFFSKEEEAQIIAAIQQAEQNTSGEIRVHIEGTSGKEALERAKEVFFQLEMNNTKAQNGVLFYVAVTDHTFAILGDKGIDAVVPNDFWDCTKDLVIEQFKQGAFAKGLETGILRAGEKLKEYFPFTSDDVNELSDEISKGDI